MLTMTPKAVEKIRGLCQSDEAKGKALRVLVKPGGCSGYEYAFTFDEKKPGDTALPQPGFEVVIDDKSLPFLEQATIDFSEDATSSGFQISNPKEKGSCGCGKSKSF